MAADSDSGRSRGASGWGWPAKDERDARRRGADGSPVVDERFLEVADARVDAIEGSAIVAREDLAAEIARLEGSGSNLSRAELGRLRAAADEFHAQSERVADIAAHMRQLIDALAGGLDESAAGGPSAGVRLLTNQMALSGRSEDEIAAVLAALGVEDTRAVVHEVLDGPQA